MTEAPSTRGSPATPMPSGGHTLRSARLAEGLAVLSFALAACAPTIEARDVPAEIRWVAALELDGARRVIAASPLLAFEPGRSLPIHVDTSATTLVIGYSDATLGDYTRFVAPTAPLRGAEGCAPRLPTPTWAAGLVDRALAEARVEDTPAIGAEWLEGQCPSEQSPVVTAFCGQVTCTPTIDPLGRCRYGVEGSVACPVPNEVLVFGPKNEVCFESRPTIECLSTPKYSPPVPELLCEVEEEGTEGATCRVDVFLPADAPPWIPPTPEVDVVSLGPVTPFVPASIDAFGDLRTRDAHRGYALGLAVLASGEVVVSMAADLSRVADCDGANADREFKLQRYDGERLALVGTSTAPACLVRLAADPGRAGFLGTYRDGRGWRIGRFDPTGRLLASAPLAPDLLDGVGARAIELRTMPGEPRVVALLGGVDDHGFTVMVELDLATFAERHRYAGAFEIWAFDVVDGHTIAFTQDPDQHLCTWDLDDPRGPSCEASACLVKAWSTFSHQAFDFLHHAQSGADVVSITIAAEGLWTCATPAAGGAPAMDARSASIWERPLEPGRMHVYPPDPRLVLVTGVTGDGDRYRTAGVLYDPARSQVLPGTWLLDQGMFVGTIREDAEARLWLLYPWDAKLVRMSFPTSNGPR